MRKLLAILGTTSTGKTDVALSLAKKFDGELVSCDSRQVYRGLDIGTGKLPSQTVIVKKQKGFWEMDGVKTWMYDVADPKKQYSVADYIADANKIINDIKRRNKLPIIVGGTGFYLKTLLEGVPNLGVPVDIKLRKELEKLSLEDLQQKLQQVSPKKWEKMNSSDRQNPRRLIRAIEIKLSQKSKVKSQKSKVKNFNILKIGLTAPRQILYQRIDEWIVSRIGQGMIDEARNLHKSGLTFKRMRQLGLEYRVLVDYLSGKIASEDVLIKILQGKIHRYARRQITWFKKEKDTLWFDIENKDFPNKLEKQIAKWYYLSYAAKD